MKRILITGACGYIGSTIVPYIFTQGGRGNIEVTAVDNLMYDQGPIFSDLCYDHRFQFVRGDARDARIMEPLVAKADFIIPLACIVGAPACDEHRNAAYSTNLDAIKLIDRLASPAQRIVFPTTNSGYGIGEPDKACTEESPLNPLSLYGRLKVEAEQIILDRENTVSLRLATVFGMSRRMRIDLLVNDFVWRAVHDKAVVLFESGARRNFLHVRDAARAILWVMDDHAANPHNQADFGMPNGSVFNVGHPHANITKRQLCERIKEIIPAFTFVDAPIGEDPDKRDYLVSNEKLSRTGFNWVYSIEDGIRELVRGYAMMRRTEFGNA